VAASARRICLTAAELTVHFDGAIVLPFSIPGKYDLTVAKRGRRRIPTSVSHVLRRQ
jgi:hypothetical protein